MGPPDGLWDKVRMLGKLKDWGGATPKTVAKGPCQDVVVEGEALRKTGLLDLMPVLTTWPRDGGPYITTPLVITRNPENGRRNIGMYRMQVFDGTTTGMHWQVHKTGAAHHAEYEKRGERMPVCVAIGGPPALTYAATAPLPPDIDEALFAGFLTGEPVTMTKAVTCDLEVPAEADFVIEGYVEPGERRLEGDFGDHTGWYSLAEEFPVFHVTADHQPARSPLPDHHRGQAAHGGRLAGLGHRAPVPAPAAHPPARGGRLPPAGGRLLPQPGDRGHPQALPGPRAQGVPGPVGHRTDHVHQERDRGGRGRAIRRT